MEQKKQHGGKRENSGRLKKDEVISLIEQMDAIAVPKDVWVKLYDKVKENDVQAIKTWLSYRYGMPKQTVDNNTNLNINDFNLKDIINFKE
jgi:hypothetical protein